MSTQEEQRLWSVTTLLGAGIPKQQQLTGWAARIVAERAFDDFAILQAFVNKGQRDEGVDWLKSARWQTVRKAAARGSALHAAAEQYNLGVTPEVEPHIMPFVLQYRQFLTDYAPKFLAAEAPVYNLTERYAGTMDGIIELEGKTVLFDVKTHEKDADARSRPPYPDIALQLVAYARAERVGVDPAQRREYNGRRYYIWREGAAWVPMPQLDGAVALAISPWGYTLTPVAVDDEVWDAFLAARAVARWALQTSQRVLGPPLDPRHGATAPAAVAFEGAEPGEPEVIPGQTSLEDALTPTPAPEPTPTAAFEGAEPPSELEGPTAEPPAFSGGEPPEDTRTEGERDMEEFMAEASQADVPVPADENPDTAYWERIANYLHAEDGPRTTTEIIKGTKSSQTKIRELIPRLAESGIIVNKGTEGRPKWALKGEHD